jgi:hypothetical protein
LYIQHYGYYNGAQLNIKIFLDTSVYASHSSPLTYFQAATKRNMLDNRKIVRCKTFPKLKWSCHHIFLLVHNTENTSTERCSYTLSATSAAKMAIQCSPTKNVIIFSLYSVSLIIHRDEGKRRTNNGKTWIIQVSGVAGIQ